MKMSRIDEAKIKVTDLKQFLYCPRIVYYDHVLPLPRKTTYKMEHGKLSQSKIEGLEKRRLLSEYNLAKGKRSFNVPLYSAELELSGVVDLLIETEELLYPVDFKETEFEPGPHHVLQLTAYAILAEKKYCKPCEKGFIYTLENDEIFEIRIDEFQRQRFYGSLKEMKALIASEMMPQPADNIDKCVNCEFKNFCRDVF